MDEKIRELIKKYAKNNAIPENILVGMIYSESNSNPRAYRYEPAFYKRYIKGKGKYPYENAPERVSASYGCYQLMFTTAYDMGYRGEPEGLYDPETNIIYACKLYNSIYDKFPEIKDEKERCKFTVAAYNAGRGSINKMLALARKVEGKQIFDGGVWQKWNYSKHFLAQITGKDNSNITIRHISKVFGYVPPEIDSIPDYIPPEKGLAEIAERKSRVSREVINVSIHDVDLIIEHLNAAVGATSNVLQILKKIKGEI